MLAITPFRRLWLALGLSRLRRLARPAREHRPGRRAAQHPGGEGAGRLGRVHPPARPGGAARPDRRRGRRPAAPAARAGLRRRAAVRAVREHPARRHPLVAVRRDGAGRGRRPVLDAGEGRHRAQPGAAAPARGRQPGSAWSSRTARRPSPRSRSAV
nr:hypothetical protein [Angustibacter aerolatus]